MRSQFGSCSVQAAISGRMKHSNRVALPSQAPETALEQVFLRADARIRTADPFITSEGNNQCPHLSGCGRPSRLLSQIGVAGAASGGRGRRSRRQFVDTTGRLPSVELARGHKLESVRVGVRRADELVVKAFAGEEVVADVGTQVRKRRFEASQQLFLLAA